MAAVTIRVSVTLPEVLKALEEYSREEYVEHWSLLELGKARELIDATEQRLLKLFQDRGVDLGVQK